MDVFVFFKHLGITLLFLMIVQGPILLFFTIVFRDYYVFFKDSLGTKLMYFNGLGITNGHLSGKS
jgi:hypothetical protein